MSMQPSSPAAPDAKYELGRHYRLRKALNYADMKVQDMADHLGVSPTSVSNWINGHTWPRRRDLRDFALRTGYPIKWLETGEIDGHSPTPEGTVTRLYQRRKPHNWGAAAPRSGRTVTPTIGAGSGVHPVAA